MKRLLALLLAAGLVAACGPVASSPTRSAPFPHFVLVVHNLDVAFAETASVSWWDGSAIVGSAELVMPKGGEAVFDLGGHAPLGLEIDATAWPAQAGGNVFGRPDYASSWVFHVAYPTGFSWK